MLIEIHRIRLHMGSLTSALDSYDSKNRRPSTFLIHEHVHVRFQSEARVINQQESGYVIEPVAVSLHVRSSILEAIKWKVAAKVTIFVNYPCLLYFFFFFFFFLGRVEKSRSNESNRNFQLSIFQPSPPFPGKIFLPGRSIDVDALTRENLSRALT